jgi:hypothetical protein
MIESDTRIRNHIPRLERRSGGHLQCIEKSRIILVESRELRLDLINHEDSRRRSWLSMTCV